MSIRHIKCDNCGREFDFDMDRVRGYIGMRHPGIPVFPVSARTGEGFAEVCSYLEDCVRKNGNE